MKATPYFIAAVLFTLQIPAHGQDLNHPGQDLTAPATGEEELPFPIPDAVLRSVLEGNKTLQAAREQYRVSSLEASTGNTPADPRVEFGYLFGKPEEMGNRVDFAVTQELDFPTAYIHRSRARDLEITKAGLELDLIRQAVLLQAVRLWISRVYLNQLEGMLERRVELAEQLVSHYRQKLTVGEVGQLAFSQANLQRTSLQGELEQARSDIRTNQAALEELTGGIVVQIADTLLPSSRPVDQDTLLAAYEKGPLMRYYRREVELKEQMKNLTTSLSLPKISAGYYSESVVTEQFRGFQLGISVPLWEHTNRIKLARSEILFAEADAERAALRQKKELTENLERRESLNHRIGEMEEALSMVNDIQLLNLAWKGGEISLAEWMVGSDLYFRNLQTLMTYRRDRLLVEAELLHVYF